MLRSFSLLALASVSIVTNAVANDPKPTIGSAIDEPMPVPVADHLIWADEFNSGSAPDPAKWTYETERNQAGWYNHEQEYYAANRPQNVRIEDGALVIEARHDMVGQPRPADFGGQAYSSGRISTRGIAAWRYGFVEVRAKLACGRGVWPAIWMLSAPPATRWPDDGELDIMEQVGHQPGVIHGTVHTRETEDQHAVSGWERLVPDSCTAFHNYQMNWTPDRVTFGVDGHAYYALDNDHSGKSTHWPFSQPQYLILNVAVGGDWGGQQGIDDRAFPSAMRVDYVRVYRP